MKKRLLCCGILAALLQGSVFAAGYTFPADGRQFGDYGILGGYDPDGRLVCAETLPILAEDGVFRIESEMMTEKAKTFRLFFPKSGTIVTDLSETAEKPTGQPPEKPEAGAEENPQISRYPTQADAATAFAVVRHAERTVVNDEEVIELSLLFRGEEVKIQAPEDKVLRSAPEAYADLTGAELDVLRTGDVIYMTSSMGNGLSTVELIFRPQEEDYVSSAEDFGTSFEKLFTVNGAVSTRRPIPFLSYENPILREHQYAFGVICGKHGSEYMTLCDRSGKGDRMIDVVLSEDTVVSVYDPTLRGKLSLASAGEIEKSEIPSSLFDEDGNITAWEEGAARNYAFVRMDDGLALDVVVYANYNL